MNRNWLLPLVSLVFAVPNVVADDEAKEAKESTRKAIVSLAAVSVYKTAGRGEEKESFDAVIDKNDMFTVTRTTYRRGKNGTQWGFIGSATARVAMKKLDPDRVTVTHRNVPHGKLLKNVWFVIVATRGGKKTVRVKDKDGRASTEAVIAFKVKDQRTANQLENALVRYIKLCGGKKK